MLDFAKLVEEHREKKQITKAELTQRSGLSSGYISLLTRGEKTSPSAETVARIADALMLDAESRARLFEAAGYRTALTTSSLRIFNRARQDWGDAPNAHVLYGRNREIEKLERWVVADGFRLVALLGPGGVGKTILASKLAEKVKDAFDYIIWRSLQNALPLDDFLRECIQFFSSQQASDIPDSPDKQISLLIERLQINRCLVIMDNVETILQDNGRYQEGYEGYGKLLQRIGEGRHQSCFILTSREKLKEIAKLEGSTFPVRSLTLGGLQLDEAKAFLKDKGLQGTEENWQALIDYYLGNPLALMFVSQLIGEVFGGDIASFLKGGGRIFSDIRDLLDEQFNRLTSLEQEIMYWLSIEREPVSPDDLMNIIARPLPREDLLEALTSLVKRSMIEDGKKPLFTLQPVIMEYINKKLVNYMYAEISGNERTFLTNYALIKASMKDYIRNTQLQLILKPIAQRLLSDLGKDGSEKALKAVLSDLQKSQHPVPGYAAGNVLNLLINLNTDLRGYNFSNLTVWEAYLRGMPLRYVNFTSSDLSRSVFTDTFGSIFSVALNMTGELLAAGTANGEIRIWTTRETHSYKILKDHTEWVRSVAFSPRKNILVSGSEDQTIKVWDVEAGACLFTLRGHTSTIYSVVFSPDGQIIGSGSDDQTIRLWELSTGSCLMLLRGHGSRIFSVAFSPDGRTIASGSGDRTVRLWDVESGTCLKILSGHTDWIWSVAFSPTKNIVASGGDDKTIRLWDVETGDLLRALESGRVYSVVFSPDGDTIACGSEGQAVRLLDVKYGRPLKTLLGYGSRIYSVAFHPDENTIASGGEDGLVRLWYAYNNQNVKELHGHTHWVWSVCFSPKDAVLASASEDRTICLWNAKTGECLRVLRGHANRVYSVAFSPDGKFLASCSGDQTIKLWDVSSGQHIRTFQGHTNHVRSVAFSPDGNTLVSGGDDKKVMIWDSNTGHSLKILEGHDNWIWSVIFSPDGNAIASCSEDKTVRIWNATTGECLAVLRGSGGSVYSLAFNHFGRDLATGSHEGIIEIWDTHTNERLHLLRSDRPYEGMKIAHTKGLSDSERTILKDLGAIEDEDQR